MNGSSATNTLCRTERRPIGLPARLRCVIAVREPDEKRFSIGTADHAHFHARLDRALHVGWGFERRAGAAGFTRHCAITSSETSRRATGRRGRRSTPSVHRLDQ